MRGGGRAGSYQGSAVSSQPALPSWQDSRWFWKAVVGHAQVQVQKAASEQRGNKKMLVTDLEKLTLCPLWGG